LSNNCPWIGGHDQRKTVLHMAYSPSIILDEPTRATSSPIQQVSAKNAKHGEDAVLGAVFTRVEVAEFILDLIGYTEDRALHQLRLLEPSFGYGDFLLSAIQRLVRAWRKRSNNGSAVEDLQDSVRAVELNQDTFELTQRRVFCLLKQEGIGEETAIKLVKAWLIQGDFLLIPLDGEFDVVVGNPPYVRQEMISAPLLVEYRRRYQTIYDRADLYIPFIERSLSLLASKGELGFICADRWMKNRYGGPLRGLVAQSYHLKFYVDMVDTPAFHSDVIAYPAITVICKERGAATRIAHRPVIDRTLLSELACSLKDASLPESDSQVRELANVTNGMEPWLLGSDDQMALLRRLEQQFPLLEDVGCKVGIGVATGSDQAYIGEFKTLDVEDDRKLPLVTTKDISSGEVVWRGQAVVNPFDQNGKLVDLRDYPRLARYFDERRNLIEKRHCARKAPQSWYRTIDKIIERLAYQPKLLIPDIKGEAHIVFEEGQLYPHHNLYYVVSDQWDLRALQAVLMSAVSRLFVATYSTKMRGGFLRFQAQYLRRIRIPHWDDVPGLLRAELAHAAVTRDLQACNRAVFRLYSLGQEEQAALGGNEE